MAFPISRLDSRTPHVSFRLLPRSAAVSLVIARGVGHVGGSFGSRWARRLARRLARGASADGSTHARRRARRLAYIVSIRDGPGGLPDGSLVSLRQICASADGSIRDGPGVLPNGSLAALQWVSLSLVRMQRLPSLALLRSSQPFG